MQGAELFGQAREEAGELRTDLSLLGNHPAMLGQLAELPEQSMEEEMPGPRISVITRP